jgi:hypothetical protein
VLGARGLNAAVPNERRLRAAPLPNVVLAEAAAGAAGGAPESFGSRSFQRERSSRRASTRRA